MVRAPTSAGYKLRPGFRTRRISSRGNPIAVLAACALAASGSLVRAQSIEPRSYSNAPVGVNFLLGGYAYTRRGVSFDTALPITNPRLTTSNAVLGYVRALDLWASRGSSRLSSLTPGYRDRRSTVEIPCNAKLTDSQTLWFGFRSTYTARPR